MLLGSVMLVACIGCSADKVPEAAKNALRHGQSFELFSLSPVRMEDKPSAEDASKRLHNWLILGKTELGEEAQSDIANALFRGVKGNDGMVAGCFNPRHGIRVTHDNKVFDFVICFECMQVDWFIDDEEQDGFLTTDSPQATFNRILKEADVPLPKRGK